MDALPHITLSYTQTLDGRIATVEGVSQWIGSGESLRFVHQLRVDHDAILVGIGTLLKDNPRLTVRLVEGRDPLRVIVDSRLRTPLTAAVLSGAAAQGTLIATTDCAGSARIAEVRATGATVEVVAADAIGRVDLVGLLGLLSERGISSVMVEGGAGIITSLLRARLVTRVVACVAPRIMGAGIEAVGDLGMRDLASMPSLTDLSVRQYGPDVVIDGRVAYP